MRAIALSISLAAGIFALPRRIQPIRSQIGVARDLCGWWRHCGREF